MPLPRAVITHHKTIGEKISQLICDCTITGWIMITAGQKVDLIAEGPASLDLGGHQVGPLVLPGGGEDNVGDVGELEYQSVSQSVRSTSTNTDN